MPRPDHSGLCSTRTHKNGKWCWLPGEIEELKQQKASGAMTWNQMSKSFVTNGINRHGTHQCHKKYFQLSYEESQRREREKL
ncbi:hypothetical protein LA080_013012 [Diaporthe eres]|nr:hypothetical protein LA080_013012 [Diaporthe eres]